jgi:hypothetical protein
MRLDEIVKIKSWGTDVCSRKLLEDKRFFHDLAVQQRWL